KLKGLLIRFNQAIVVFSLVIIAFAIPLAAKWSESKEGLLTLAAALVLMPFLALGNVRGAILREFKHVVKGQLPESVFRPTIFFIMILATYYAMPNAVSPSVAMIMHLGAGVLTFIIGSWMLINHLPPQVKNSPAE